ncbi:enoyl-CoA hydratase [Brevundimonas sp. LM2]|uniref:enoyl-CoA hydratase/isomerase family protein n=1 Tax=Brevundimonas sp. LM2 TaxID=1938605 RepID=UPI000983DDC3|nr:enoyl-CoA hydratase/isomerase family protein [Brevundimonas sp. LM2]AQR61868.1 enoyl-CoA hydratase [Brevundimonas sp. LM2]
MADDYRTLQITKADGVATVQLSNAPINLLDETLMGEIRRFLDRVRSDPGVRVIIFESRDPDFFLAHVDMTLGTRPEAVAELTAFASEALNPFQAFAEALRAQPQVTIVKLKGLARGGGAEFVAAADMAFAAEQTAGLAQCEALMGIIPGGGATQYLPARMTRGRALEVVLGAALFDARTAERYGWINRALPTDTLDAFVDTLARNIAALPSEIVAAAKAAIGQADHAAGFLRETAGWAGLAFRPDTADLMAAQLRSGAQTREGERDLEGLLRQVQG